jgi:hypothetical protein
MLAVLSSAVLLSFFSLTSSSAETYNHTEEYMQQHDGGDRAEYLQWNIVILCFMYRL